MVNLFHLMFFQNAYQLLNQNGECPLVLKNATFFFYSLRLNFFNYVGLPILESSYNIFFVFKVKDFNGRKVIQQKKVNVSIIEDNNVFKGSAFVTNRFTYLFEFGQNQKVNLSLFIETQIFFQVIKQVTKQNGEPFPNTEHKS